jgi:hypothetical protein
MATWFVDPLPERPDFRLIISFLWGDFHDVDSDGDSSNPASRDWTWLSVRNRGQPAETVDIELVSTSTTCFKVEAGLSWLTAATAYFLAIESSGRVRAEQGTEWLERQTLTEHTANFDLDAAVARARHSIWRKATLANPYPNRTKG